MDGFIKGLLKLCIIVAVIGGVVIAIFRFFYVDVAVVGHNGMAPTLLAGDEVALWRGSIPDFGDVAICPDPRGLPRYVIGRVVGKAGFQIRSDRGQLIINQQHVAYDFGEPTRFEDTVNQRVEMMRVGQEELGKTTHAFFLRKDRDFQMRDTTVKRGLFLLSDNRHYVGEDSRMFGEVDPTTCLGVVFMILRAAPSDAAIDHGWLKLID